MIDPFVQVVVASILGQIGGMVPDSVTQIASNLPEPLSVTGAVFYGAWGVFGATTAKSLLGRVRSGGGSGPSPTVKQNASTVEYGTGGTGSGGSQKQKSNAAFTLPSFLPLSKGIRTVTHHEVHAIELGIVVGVTNAWLLSHGRRNVAITIAVVFVAGALGYKRYKSKAFRTIRMEPWYALLAFGGGSIVGMALFDPAALRSLIGL